MPLEAPCGVCVGCRTSRALGWATRARFELEDHKHAHFVTLTYTDDTLPGPSLKWEDLRNFWKSLRKHQSVRYLACGEYGEQTNRPHFHAVIFGLHLVDLVPWDHRQKVSAWLDKVWGFGQVFVGEANPATAAYTAGYTAKKLRGISTPAGLEPEDIRVSTKPALGSCWALKHASELIHDRIPLAPGRFAPVPKHILQLLKEDHPTIYRAIKARRRARAEAAAMDKNRPSYLSVEANLLARQRRRDNY